MLMTTSPLCDDKCNCMFLMLVRHYTLSHLQVLLSVRCGDLGVYDRSPDHPFESFPHSPASSILSDPPQPPTKKRRISTSSLSDAEEAAFVAEAVDDDDDDDDDDDEENRPLAARMVGISSTSRTENSFRMPGQRSGKKIMQTTPMSSSPAPLEQPQNGITNGTHDPAVKVEDVMDENQLTRLAAGVTVDTARGTTTGVCSQLVLAFKP